MCVCVGGGGIRAWACRRWVIAYISRVDKENNNTSSGSIAQKSYMISTDLPFIVMCEHFLTNSPAAHLAQLPPRP